YPLGMMSLILGAGERAEIVLDLNEAAEETVHLLINNFKALEINIIDELEENVEFSYTLSLREDLFDVIYPEEVAELPMRHIIMKGTDERVAIMDVNINSAESTRHIQKTNITCGASLIKKMI